MDTIGELSFLTELICLFANDNLLNDFDDISHALSIWKQLQKLEMTGNPVCNKSKYRDNIIVASQSLGRSMDIRYLIEIVSPIFRLVSELLDGKQINKLERRFLMSWKASKETRRRMKLESRLMSMSLGLFSQCCFSILSIYQMNSLHLKVLHFVGGSIGKGADC